jgi:hypothetical protein
MEAAMIEIARSEINDAPLPPEEAVDAEFEEMDQLHAAVKTVVDSLDASAGIETERDTSWLVGSTKVRLHWGRRPAIWIYRP